MLTRDLIIFYSRAFTDENTTLARKHLNRQNTSIRKSDAIVIAFCLGVLTFNVIVLLYLCREGGDWQSELGAGIMIYYATGVMIYIVFATGLCIQVFKSYGINYPFIFEIDQNYRLTHHQIYKIGLCLSVVWLACLTGQIQSLKTDETDKAVAVFSILLVILFSFMCLNPCQIMYKTVRV
jgi:hypothetical protein